MGALIGSETKAAEYQTGMKALVPPNLDLTAGSSQDQLGCATVTNNPQISVVWLNTILFLYHEICSLWVNRSSVFHGYLEMPAALTGLIACWSVKAGNKDGARQALFLKAFTWQWHTSLIPSFHWPKQVTRLQGSARGAKLPCALKEKQKTSG